MGISALGEERRTWPSGANGVGEPDTRRLGRSDSKQISSIDMNAGFRRDRVVRRRQGPHGRHLLRQRRNPSRCGHRELDKEGATTKYPERAARVAEVRDQMRETDRAYEMKLALIRSVAELTQKRTRRTARRRPSRGLQSGTSRGSLALHAGELRVCRRVPRTPCHHRQRTEHRVRPGLLRQVARLLRQVTRRGIKSGWSARRRWRASVSTRPFERSPSKRPTPGAWTRTGQHHGRQGGHVHRVG